MGNIIRTNILLFSILFLASCSSQNSCIENNDYKIDLYSGGGVTGFEQGVTVQCTGEVLFWNRKPGSEKEITSEESLDEQTSIRISELMKNGDLLTYKHTWSGNYTSYLNITKDKQTNTISFDPAALPADMPSSVSELIKEIKKINHGAVNEN